MTPLQKLPKNVGDLGKFIVAKGFEKLPEVQEITKSGHTAHRVQMAECLLRPTDLCSLISGLSYDRTLRCQSSTKRTKY